MNRRNLLTTLAAGTLSTTTFTNAQSTNDTLTRRVGKPKQPLQLDDFQPKSMLHVPSTVVERAKFPVVDVHTHWAFSDRHIDGPRIQYRATPEELLAVMDRCNIRTLFNVTGSFDKNFKDCYEKYDKKHPGRFYTMMEPQWHRAEEPGYAKMQAEAVEREAKAGARGMKVLKTLGLFLRDKQGKLVKIDDPRFDPMWEACAANNITVFMHVSDPEAFFLPTDRYNERFEELNNHPDWSFHGKDFPSHMELMEARNRVLAKHPKTHFVLLHWGNNAENQELVGQWMDKYPNTSVEMGARIGELGRSPRTTRKFIDKYQDRCIFGTDATPKGYNVPQQLFGEELYRIYFRFLETEDEYFDYAPAKVPPQGRWNIYGLGLPDNLLKKIYHGNIDRIMGIS